MKIVNVGSNAQIEFSYEELLLINSVLNEVCNGIELFEFETRIGAPRDKVEGIMLEIRALLDRITNARSPELGSDA